MSKTLITTLIPTYRRPRMLRRAICSVLSQTYKDFRLCIYDNASGDETAEVVDEFRRKDPRVECLFRPSNLGSFANWVDAAKRVKTPFFSFLPDDDLLLPHFLESALAGFRRFPEAAFSMLATLHISPWGFIRDAWVLQWPRDGLFMPPEGMLCCLRHGLPGLPAMLIRHDAWDELGGFDEATEPCADFDFEMRASASLPIVVSRHPGAMQVMHNHAQTAGADLRWVWPPLPRIINKFQHGRLPAAARQEAIERLKGLLKKGLIIRGGLASLKDGKWADAERSADLLQQECGLARAARTVRAGSAMCRRVPGLRLLPSALLGLRGWQKAARNLRLRWKFRSYVKLLWATSAEVPRPQARRPQLEALR